jgi:hypothetical protein
MGSPEKEASPCRLQVRSFRFLQDMDIDLAGNCKALSRGTDNCSSRQREDEMDKIGLYHFC